jgi:hypothetical protein
MSWRRPFSSAGESSTRCRPTRCESQLGRPWLRPRLLGAALALALVAIPAVALADQIGGLFGFSTQGQPVPTSATPFSQTSGLNEAMTELGFPSTLQLVARRDGISFYAAPRSDGRVCVAVAFDAASPAHKAVGCDLGNPSLAGEPAFPSPQRPILDFSRFGGHFAGFAADGVSEVELLDRAGDAIASAPVVDNVYAEANPPTGGSAVEALDGRGAVVYRRSFDQAP